MIKPRFEIIDEVSSTNLLLKERAKYEKEGKVIIANTQTAGRGRLGRSFFSPAGSGLYMSILLKPEIAPEESLLITTCAAVAVCGAVETLSGKEAGIKWVNDIFIGGKKVCGILTESAVSGGMLEYAVLGIGVNLYDCGFPDDIKNIAGAVFDGKPCGFEMRDKMAREICNRFFAYYEKLTDKRFLKEYQRRCIITGKKIKVLKNGAERYAVAIGITDSFELEVEYSDKIREKLSSGEVSIRVSRQ